MNKLTPAAARTLAETHMSDHLDAEWTFKFNNRKRAAGICNYDRKTIELGRGFVELNDESQVEQTILHEIAHALAGYKAAHGPEWKHIARRIGVLNPKSSGRFNTAQGKYRLECGCCGAVLRASAHRRTDMSKRYHPKCGRASVGQLVWKTN